MEDPPSLEYRLVPPPRRAVAEDRRRDREGSHRLGLPTRKPETPTMTTRGDLKEPQNDIERDKEMAGTNGESGCAWAFAYVESNQEVPSSTPIPDTRPSVLAGVVATLVQIEGPIHKDEIARRLTSLWGLQRTGPRIAEAISNAVEAGVGSGNLRAELDFITHSQQSTVPVRNRSQVTASNLKKPEMIPPSEVRQAILHFVKEHLGLHREEVPAMVSRVLGFKTTSPKLKELVDKTLTSVLEAGDVVPRDDKLFLA